MPVDNILLAEKAKVIIGDYLHIFHPKIRTNLFNKLDIHLQNSIIIVDEAHNVPDRVRDIMTVGMSTALLSRAAKEATFIGQKDMEDIRYFLTSHRKAGGTGLMRVDAETGTRKSFDEKYIFGNLVGVGDKMIMLAENGELIWGDLDDDGFKETFRQKILDGLCWANPVLVDDNIYARNAEGTIICLQLQ